MQDNDNIYNIVTEGHSLFSKGKFIDAEKFFQKAINLGFNDNEIYYNMAQIGRINGNVYSIQKYYDLAVKYGNVNALVDLGIFEFNKGQFANATQYWKGVIDSNNINAIKRIYKFHYGINNMMIAHEYRKILAEKGDTSSIKDMINFYKATKDMTNLHKYYIMGIEKKIPEIMWYSLILLSK
jgi:tetratricopeptide (TPR) repeat protein